MSLQKQVVKIAHEGYQDIVKIKARLREAVWFPKRYTHVLSELQQCLPCQATSQPNRPQPISVTPMPGTPWDKVKIDFYGLLPSGQHILVVIDCYSRFPEILTAISALEVIPKLDCMFARHGIPSYIPSDNGPPIQRNEFYRYMSAIWINRTTSTPLWPRKGSKNCLNFCSIIDQRLIQQLKSHRHNFCIIEK